MNKYLVNWKTTSLGITSIIGAITRIVFAIKNKDFGEEAVATTTAMILTGIGLIFARDYDKSSEDSGVVPAPKDTTTPTAVKLIPLFLIPMFLSGCGWTSLRLASPVMNANGTAVCDETGGAVLRESKVTSYALFQADNAAKVKVANGEWNKDRQSGNSDSTATSDMGTVMMKGMLDLANTALQAYTLGQAGKPTTTGSINVQTPVVTSVPTLTVVTNFVTPDGGNITCYSDGSCIRTPPITFKNK